MPGESILQTLQKLATVMHRLDAVVEDLRDLRQSANARLDRLEGHGLATMLRLDATLCEWSTGNGVRGAERNP
jgi:hypothetical protein